MPSAPVTNSTRVPKLVEVTKIALEQNRQLVPPSEATRPAIAPPIEPGARLRAIEKEAVKIAKESGAVPPEGVSTK